MGREKMDKDELVAFVTAMEDLGVPVTNREHERRVWDLARAFFTQGMIGKWHQALGQIAGSLEMPDGASLADDVPQAVDNLLATAESDRLDADQAIAEAKILRELLIELRTAACNYWEKAPREHAVERHAHELLWAVLDKVREVVGPLGEEKNDASGHERGSP